MEALILVSNFLSVNANVVKIRCLHPTTSPMTMGKENKSISPLAQIMASRWGGASITPKNVRAGGGGGAGSGRYQPYFLRLAYRGVHNNSHTYIYSNIYLRYSVFVPLTKSAVFCCGQEGAHLGISKPNECQPPYKADSSRESRADSSS